MAYRECTRSGLGVVAKISHSQRGEASCRRAPAYRLPLEAGTQRTLSSSPTSVCSGATKTPTLPRDGWRAAVKRRLETLDWKAVIADLRPFVERQSDLEVRSKEAIYQLLEGQ